eukprot:14283368-Ditylum_brightwellii.AAC.1
MWNHMKEKKEAKHVVMNTLFVRVLSVIRDWYFSWVYNLKTTYKKVMQASDFALLCMDYDDGNNVSSCDWQAYFPKLHLPAWTEKPSGDGAMEFMMIDAKSDDCYPNFNIKYEKVMKDDAEADRDLCIKSFQRLKEFLIRLSEQEGEEEERKTFKKHKTGLRSL